MPEQPNASHKMLTRRRARELDVQISFLEGLVRRDSDCIETLQMLGDHYVRRGQHDSSFKVDQQLARLQPHNPLVFYDLACGLALKSEVDRAAEALEKALALGYRDFKCLAKDPDLHQLRQHPLYRQIQTKIRKMRVEIA